LVDVFEDLADRQYVRRRWGPLYGVDHPRKGKRAVVSTRTADYGSLSGAALASGGFLILARVLAVRFPRVRGIASIRFGWASLSSRRDLGRRSGLILRMRLRRRAVMRLRA